MRAGGHAKSSVSLLSYVSLGTFSCLSLGTVAVLTCIRLQVPPLVCSHGARLCTRERDYSRGSLEECRARHSSIGRPLIYLVCVKHARACTSQM